MKRIIAVSLAALMLFSLGACTHDTDIPKTAPASDNAPDTTESVDNSAKDGTVHYVGESGMELAARGGYAQIRFTTYGEAKGSVAPSDGYGIANIASIDTQWTELLSADNEDGMIDAFYELNEAYALDIAGKYADALNGGNLRESFAFSKTFESDDMFPIILYEAGYEYVGNSNITCGLAKSDFLSTSFDVRMTLQIKTGSYCYLHLYYPQELELINAYSGETQSAAELYDTKLGGSYGADDDMHHFFFSGFDGSHYLDLYFDAGSYSAGDFYTWDQLNSASYSAIRRADYDLGFIRRDPFFTTDSVDAVDTLNVRIVERNDDYSAIYFHLIALRDDGRSYELEGLGCTASNQTENTAADGQHMCVFCGGDGKDGCSKCGGTGKDRKLNSATGGYTDVICTKCNGTGKVICQWCAGSGKRDD